MGEESPYEIESHNSQSNSLSILNTELTYLYDMNRMCYHGEFIRSERLPLRVMAHKIGE